MLSRRVYSSCIRCPGLGGVFAYAICAFTSIFALPHAMNAQISGGGIRGTITDASGAALASAQIEIEAIATGERRKLLSNTSGYFNAPNLVVGIYSVKVTAQHFRESIRTGIDIQVSTFSEVDFRLAVAGAEENVTITPQSTTVDLVTSQVEGVDSGRMIRELPLNGRDWTTLAALQPGVSTVSTQNATNLDVLRGNRGYGAMMTISGSRPEQSSYWLDGINVNDYSGGGPGSVLGVSLGVDAIEEFSVITSNTAAEYGRTSGGAIVAVTRDGTNQVHGSAYEFLRNSALDARNYFDGPSLPPFRRNDFGGSIGGPIRRNKDFFFSNYEGVRQGLGTTTVDTVPSAEARTGNLSSGQVILNPLVTPFLTLFPLPNGKLTGDTGSYSFSSQDNSSEDFVVSRVDHRFTDKDSLHGTYLFDTSSTTGPDTFDGVLLGISGRRQVGTTEWSHIFNPATINFVRIGLNRIVANQVDSIAPINPAAADPSLGFLPGRNVGEITIGGITQYPGGLGASGDYQFHYTSAQLYDDLTMTRGAHLLKVGVALEGVQSNAIGAGTNNGNATFGSLASFLTDAPASFVATIPGTNVGLGMRQWIIGAYAQDDWTIDHRLTLNLGLRYEIATVPEEQQNRLATLVFGSQQLKQGAPFFQNPTFHDFSPRIGMAWDVFGNGKTVWHLAFGQYDSLPLTGLFSLVSVLSAPFTLQGSSTSVPAGSFPGGLYDSLAAGGPRAEYIQQDPKRSYVLQWNAALEQRIAPYLIFDLDYLGSHGVHLPMIDNDINTVPPASITGSAYIWPTPVGSGIRPWPTWGTVTAVMWQAGSSYNALQARLRKDFNRGVVAQLSYTWSKSLDTASNSLPTAYTNTVSNLPYFAPKLLRSYSDFDVAQSLSLNGTWNLPRHVEAGKAIDRLFGGWELGSLVSAESGLPFTATIAGDPLGLRSSIPYDFPDRLDASGCQHPVNPGNALHYIKLSCFAAPTPSTRLGDAGRNSIRAPLLASWDASFFRNIALAKEPDSYHLQFRFEAFNVLNHTNFAPPSSSSLQLFTQSLGPIASAGNLTSTSTTSRQLQLGFKFIW